ncbi:MAG: class I tRNA ligase family protein, partial [Caldivirga sp.]|nr:class I tRNA ligase family protein [Caldivirga sp.]
MEPKLKEKSWDLKRELELLEIWDKERGSESGKGRGIREGKVLVIDTPPPYMSGRPHIGQFATYAQMDMIARFYRMRGYTVVFPWYADRNGLPVEVEVEKRLGRRMQDVPREEFLRLCKAQLDEYEREWVKVLRRWGISAEYIPNGTDSVEYRTMTQATFIEMWNKGLIYEAERPTIWCP